MRVLELQRPAPIAERPLVSVERQILLPRPGELLVRVSACAVCRTDLQLAEGDLGPHRLPIVPGHQAVGRVAAIGVGVERWGIGDRVGAYWLARSCGTCPRCLAGRENLCELAAFTGWDRDGGFAEMMVVRADTAVRIPDGFDDLAAASLLCGGTIGYRALRLAGVEPGPDGRGAAGMRVGLYGFGASALIAIQVARHWGCEVHVASRSRDDLDRALALGAASVGGYDDPPPHPLDAAITFAPVGSVVVSALRALDRGATVAINAIHLDGIPAFPYDLLWWERSIRSVANVTRRDARELMALAATIPIRTTVETFPLEAANDALARLKEGRIEGAAVLVMEPGEDVAR